MAQQGGANHGDDQLYTMLAILLLMIVLYVMRDDMLKAWMESTYSRLQWLAGWPLVGGLFADMAANYKAHPVFSNTIKYDYIIGWFFGLVLVPLLIWSGIKAHRVRKMWSNRVMTPALFGAVIGRKQGIRFRQALSMDEWLKALKLDVLYEQRGNGWLVTFRQGLTLQVTSGGEAKPDHPMLLAFAIFLGLPPAIANNAAKEHKYLSTAMVRMFAYARAKNGVVQEHGFAEKLLSDRNLAPIYFALQSLGGNCVFAEAIGIMEHYQAELSIHKPIKTIQSVFAEEIMERCLADREAERERIRQAQWQAGVDNLEIDL